MALRSGEFDGETWVHLGDLIDNLEQLKASFTSDGDLAMAVIASSALAIIRKAYEPGRAEVPHGTEERYNQSCRCDECLAVQG